MRILYIFLIMIAISAAGEAQSFDLLRAFTHEGVTFQYSRKGTPSTFMGGDTASQFSEFDGHCFIRDDEVFAPDGQTIRHNLNIRWTGQETVRTSRRIVSQKAVDTMTIETIIERLGDGGSTASNSLRGWLFPDSTWNSPPCPGIPDTNKLYPYPQFYRYYTPPGGDSLDVRDWTLHLRTLQTDCLDYGLQREFRCGPGDGLEEFIATEFNFFDWSKEERYTLTFAQSVDEQAYPTHCGLELSCYPNPVNATTMLRCEVTTQSIGRIVVHDVQGRIVRVLHDGWIHAGTMELPFDARGLPTGLYFCVCTTETGTRSIPVVVLSFK